MNEELIQQLQDVKKKLVERKQTAKDAKKDIKILQKERQRLLGEITASKKGDKKITAQTNTSTGA